MDLSDQKTQLLLLGVLGFLGLIYVWYTYILEPKNVAIGELEGQVTELSGEIQRLEIKVRRLPGTEAQLETLQTRWEEILLSFPTQPKEEEVLDNLTLSEQSAGLYITSFLKAGRRVRDLYIEEDYTVSMIGRYNQLESFIRILASLPRRMAVNFMQLVHPSVGTGGAGGIGGVGGQPPQDDEVVIRCTITTFQVREGG